VKPSNPIATIVRVILILALVGLIIYSIFFFDDLKQNFVDFIDWLSKNAWLGFFLFIIIYILCTVFFIPGSILTIGSGYAFT